MAPTLLLLAEVVSADPTGALTGAGGWAGAGLLGLVLSWLLLKHLPDRDKQVKETQDANAAQVKSIVDQFSASLKEQRLEFADALKTQQASYMASQDKAETRWQRATDDICERLEKIEERVTSAGFLMRTQEQNEVLLRAVENAKRQQQAAEGGR